MGAERQHTRRPAPRSLGAGLGSVIGGFLHGASEGGAFQLDAVGPVDQAVEDRIGDGGVADGVVPGRDRELAGHDGGLEAVAILEDLQEVVPTGSNERSLALQEWDIDVPSSVPDFDLTCLISI